MSYRGSALNPVSKFNFGPHMSNTTSTLHEAVTISIKNDPT